MSASPTPPRLRELRMAQGWTQEEVAERLVQLAWTRFHQQAAVNADMVGKWERGTKGISLRYRKLLAALFRVTIDQLGLDGPAEHPAHDDESLVAILDNAAELLNQLGGAAHVVRPQVLAALSDEMLSRRSLLAILDPTPPATRSAPTDATLADLEDLAAQYETAYHTAAPAALLTAVAAQLRITTDALRTEQSAGARQRYLRNRARVAILAGRLAGDDLGNVMTARAYFAQATDDAHQLGDQAVAAIAIGYTAQLAIHERQPAAALAHLRTAAALAVTDPTITSWLAGLEATAYADAGNHPAARDAIDRAQALLAKPTAARAFLWFTDRDPAHLAAVAGHVQLKAGDVNAAHLLTSAASHLESLGPRAYRLTVLCLVDDAEAALQTGALKEAVLAAGRAVELLRSRPYAIGATRLRAFRDTYAQLASDTVGLRSIDDQLAHFAA